MGWYWRPDEDRAPQASSVVASAEDAEYPAEYLVSEDPAEPARLTTPTGDFVLSFAAPVAIGAAALIYHYLDAGLEVRIQGHTANSWGAPDFNQAFTIPAKRLDGPSYQRWTTNPVLRFASVQTFQYWRLVIVGTNSQNVQIGRLMLLAAAREVTLFDEAEEVDTTQAIVQPTYLGVENIFTLEGPRRSVSTTFLATDRNAGTAPVQEAADFRALSQAAEGVAHPFLLVPFDDRPNDAWLVRFEDVSRRRTHRVGGYQVWPIAVREVSRGLPWP